MWALCPCSAQEVVLIHYQRRQKTVKSTVCVAEPVMFLFVLSVRFCLKPQQDICSLSLSQRGWLLWPWPRAFGRFSPLLPCIPERGSLHLGAHTAGGDTISLWPPTLPILGSLGRRRILLTA